MIRGSKIFWDPFACFCWTFCSFSDKSNNSAKEKSHIYLSEQFSCSNSKHHTYYSYKLPKSGKFYQKTKAMGCNSWAPALPPENWTSASTVVIEDRKGALQKNTGDRDSRILSDCSGFQQWTTLGSKNCWQSLGSCSAICHRPEYKLQQTGRKPSSLCLTVFQHIVTSCKSLHVRTRIRPKAFYWQSCATATWELRKGGNKNLRLGLSTSGHVKGQLIRWRPRTKHQVLQQVHELTSFWQFLNVLPTKCQMKTFKSCSKPFGPAFHSSSQPIVFTSTDLYRITL